MICIEGYPDGFVSMSIVDVYEILYSIDSQLKETDYHKGVIEKAMKVLRDNIAAVKAKAILLELGEE